MSFTTVFFDVGGTLIHPDMNCMLAPLLQRVQPDAAALVTAERSAKLSFHHVGSCDNHIDRELSGHAGPVNRGYWQTYFEVLLESAGGHPDLLSELTRRAGDSSYWSLVDPGAPEVLEKLRHNYRLAIISNADGFIDRVLRQAGLLDFFEVIVDSGLVGCEKPDPRIFQSAMERMGVAPAESLYVGDIYAIDYAGATAAGMTAVLIDPNAVYEHSAVTRIPSLADLPDWIAARP